MAPMSPIRRWGTMRFAICLLPLCLAACGGSDNVADNVVGPPISVTSETPGDWSALAGMIGRRPSESGLIENSPISVDLAARLGPDSAAYRDAMMRAGPLVRDGALMVSRGPDAWLVIQPAEHAFRAGLLRNGRWQDWQTPGASVPRPAA